MLVTSKHEKEIRETRRRDEHIALTNRRLPNSLGSGPDCELQAMQIFPSRNRDRPELHQVRSSPLSIEKLKPRLVQPFYQCNKSHFRSTGNMMKHGLTKKSGADDDSVETAD